MGSKDFGELLFASTPAQRRLTLAVAMGGLALASVCAGLAGVEWTTWQWSVALFVAFDLTGGVASMCLPPAIRKIRPPDQPLKPLAFAAFHVHPILLAVVLPNVPMIAMVALYAAAVIGTLLALAVPVAMRASVVLAWTASATVVITLAGTGPGLEWLAPVYLLKLVGSWAVQEPPAADRRSAKSRA